MSIGRTTWEKKKNTHLFVKKCKVFISIFDSPNSWKKPICIIRGLFVKFNIADTAARGGEVDSRAICSREWQHCN